MRLLERSLYIGRFAIALFRLPACLGQGVGEGAGSLRRVQLSVDGAEYLHFIVFVEQGSGTPIEDDILIPIRWAINRPPTDGSMADISDSEEAVQGAL